MVSESPRAVLLVGGKGSRLRPFTATFPKPLMPLDDTPILEVLLRQLLRCNISRVTLALGHLGELIQAYLSHRPQLTEQLDIDYVHETTPLGTSGAVALVDGLTDTFLVMNGDVLTDLDFQSLLTFHRERDAALTIAAHQKEVPIDLGVLQTDDDGVLHGYVEKPVETFQVSMGVYVYEPRVLAYIEPGHYLDFPDLVLRLVAAGEKVVAFKNDALWLDIGRPDDYALAQERFASQQMDTPGG
jgi:NDP-sugar pyrophosphorylase family protein